MRLPYDTTTTTKQTFKFRSTILNTIRIIDGPRNQICVVQEMVNRNYGIRRTK